MVGSAEAWMGLLLTGLLGVPLSDKSGTVPNYPGSAGRGGDVGAAMTPAP